MNDSYNIGGARMKINSSRIKIYLAERKITQSKLAELCGLSRQNISTILAKGRCNPVTAGKIADGLGVHVSEIIKEES
jgi:DNA-binding XRE family transcriptional regulator